MFSLCFCSVFVVFSVFRLPAVGRQSADRYFGEFFNFTIGLRKVVFRPFLFILLLKQVDTVSKEWAANADLPPHVVQMLNNFPETLHPMSQFSAAITAMNSESKFTKAYASGAHKATYWEVKND